MKNLRKYKKIFAILSSGVIGLTLVGSNEKAERYCEDYSISISSTKINDVSEEVLETIEMIHNMQNMYLDSADFTYGDTEEKINYDEIIVSPDQSSVFYFYEDNCVKRISCDSVWLKTEEGSTIYNINDNYSYSVTNKNYQENTEIKKIYHPDGSYIIKRTTQDNKQQIIEQKLSDGSLRKWYYAEDEKPLGLPRENPYVNWYTSYSDIMCISYSSNGIDKIQTFKEEQYKKSYCIVYSNGNAESMDIHMDELGNSVSCTRRIYSNDIIEKEYENDKIVEEFKDGKRYYYDDNENVKYYEVKSEQGITRYNAGDIKIEFEDNDGIRTTYYESGKVKEIIDGTEFKRFYESGELEAVKEGDTTTCYYESKKIKTIATDEETRRWYESGQLQYIGNSVVEIGYYTDGTVSMKKLGDSITTYYKDGTTYKEGSGNVSFIEFHGEDITYGIFADNISEYSRDGYLVYEKNLDNEKWYYKSNKVFATKDKDKTLGYYETGEQQFIIEKGHSRIFYESGAIKYNLDGEMVLYIDSEGNPQYNLVRIGNQIEYYENGNIKELISDDKFVSYYESGQKQRVSDGESSVSYYENGEKESETNKDGVRTFYYESGNIRGITEGDKQTWYYESGALSSIIENGNQMSYYENGNPQMEKVGDTEIGYYETGIVKYQTEGNVKTWYYENGEPKAIEDGETYTKYYNEEDTSYYYVHQGDMYYFYHADELLYSCYDSVELHLVTGTHTFIKIYLDNGEIIEIGKDINNIK